MSVKEVSTDINIIVVLPDMEQSNVVVSHAEDFVKQIRFDSTLDLAILIK